MKLTPYHSDRIADFQRRLEHEIRHKAMYPLQTSKRLR